jgi:hypothetical protein
MFVQGLSPHGLQECLQFTYFRARFVGLLPQRHETVFLASPTKAWMIQLIPKS